MRMMALAISAALLAASSSMSGAQTPAQSGPQNPPVKTENGNNSSAPVKGANSYTQSEAQSRWTRFNETAPPCTAEQINDDRRRYS